MSNIANSIYNMRLLEDLARKDTAVHKLHPLSKLLTTVVYLAVVISFGRAEIGALLPFVFYPLLVFVLGDLPPWPILKRILYVEPFIIGIGILNPILDQQTVLLGTLAISRGWLTFASLFLKSGLTVTAALLLISTTGMDKLGSALRLLKVPRLFVLQLLLTYRYISVLLEEAARLLRAYSLRAPMQKGVAPSAWGSLAGQLLLRTFDRAQRVYQAMVLRGFEGEYRMGADAAFKLHDLIYMLCWTAFFIFARVYNLPQWLGSILTGVVQ